MSHHPASNTNLPVNAHETGPPPVILTVNEILTCAKLLDDHDIEVLGELIAHFVHHGAKKYNASYVFRTTMQDLQRIARNQNANDSDVENANKILKILEKYGVTEELVFKN